MCLSFSLPHCSSSFCFGRGMTVITYRWITLWIDMWCPGFSDQNMSRHHISRYGSSFQVHPFTMVTNGCRGFDTHTHPTTQQKSKRDYDLANLLGNFKYDSSGRVANWGMFPCHACWRAMWSACWSCIQHHRTIGFHNWGYDMVWTNQFFLISGADWLWL